MGEIVVNKVIPGERVDSITKTGVKADKGIASDVPMHLYHSSSNVHYLGCVYCIVVVVMSNEEPQMSPCISITAAVMSIILGVYTVLLLLSCPMKSFRCPHPSLSQQQQCPLSWMSPYISITAAEISTLLGVYTVLLLLSCPMKSLRCIHTSLLQQQQCPLCDKRE
ncbi:hypothetical protein LAZ67_14000016 [Cordylochernes scorpioides]|uniref:Uncharacterized protein n=1 Tax=Cordylochernes scorpioides TaxID=51811 RepID=A0ABY6L5C3_9ARAC|nr:hypothetical protein LAZ67_14000016 [Cordylochernes scorpioides]